MSERPRAVILAAGQGTRMRSAIPKVLHDVGGRPLILHVIDLATRVTGQPPIVIADPAQSAVHRAVEGRTEIVHQSAERGTGAALRSVPLDLRRPGPVLVLSGDVPLLRDETLIALLDAHGATRAAVDAPAHAVDAATPVDCTLLTVPLGGSRGLGRVVRGPSGRVDRIVEEADLALTDVALTDIVPGDSVPADPASRKSQAPEGNAEGNAGVYVFEGRALWPALDRLTPSNAQGELYLTDVIGLLGGRTAAMTVADPAEAMGINDRRQLAAAEAVLRRRRLDALMDSGVTIEDPATTYVDADVEVGPDSVIHPMSFLRGRTRLGRNCSIGPMAQLDDVVGGDRITIGASHLDQCVLDDDVTIGQYDRVRPNTNLGAGVSLGTHAEVKNSQVGAGTRISHFACVLDSDVGEGVNVGAGTVTCNYDGLGKHRTTIERGVFIGTNSTIVAPVRLGEGSYIAAGSLINTDVPAGALGVGRSRQRTIMGWVARRRRPSTAEAR